MWADTVELYTEDSLFPWPPGTQHAVFLMSIQHGTLIISANHWFVAALVALLAFLAWKVAWLVVERRRDRRAATQS